MCIPIGTISTRTVVLNPQVCRGEVHASVTCIETKIPRWEEKETLTEKAWGNLFADYENRTSKTDSAKKFCSCGLDCLISIKCCI